MRQTILIKIYMQVEESHALNVQIIRMLGQTQRVSELFQLKNSE